MIKSKDFYNETNNYFKKKKNQKAIKEWVEIIKTILAIFIIIFFIYKIAYFMLEDILIRSFIIYCIKCIIIFILGFWALCRLESKII